MDIKELRALAAKLSGDDRKDLERILTNLEKHMESGGKRRGPKPPPSGQEKVRKHINMPLDVAEYYDNLPGSSSAYVVDLIRQDMKGREYTPEGLDLLWELTQESLEGQPDQQWESREEWREDCETLTDIPNLTGPNGLNGAGATNAAAKGDVPALVWLRVDVFGLPAFS